MNNNQAKIESLLKDILHWSHLDPVNYVKVVGAFTDIRADEYRHNRAAILRQALETVLVLTKQMDYPDELIIRDGECLVRLDGLLLDALAAGIYLKHSGAHLKSIGRSITDYLNSRELIPRVAVDVGANFGEVSLWLAKTFPDVEILAIEASPENAIILEKNLMVQDFSTDNISVIQKAVTDKKGTVQFMKGVNTMVRIVREGEQTPSVKVPCDRLDAILAENGIEQADVIKIDIEGAEPLLQESFVSLAGRVRHYYIEFSNFSPREHYLSMAKTLNELGYICRSENDDKPLEMDGLANFLVEHLDQRKEWAQNLWFSQD